MAPLITDKSWLIFDMLRHRKAEIQWMKTPEFLKKNDFYLEFRATVKGLDFVNDCSERAVKLVQDLTNRAYSEEKRHLSLQVIIRKAEKVGKKLITKNLLVPKKSIFLWNIFLLITIF